LFGQNRKLPFAAPPTQKKTKNTLIPAPDTEAPEKIHQEPPASRVGRLSFGGKIAGSSLNVKLLQV
jgi:hypothetical protein